MKIICVGRAFAKVIRFLWKHKGMGLVHVHVVVEDYALGFAMYGVLYMYMYWACFLIDPRWQSICKLLTLYSHKRARNRVIELLHVIYFLSFSALCGKVEVLQFRGVARILGKGVLDYVCEVRMQNFKPRPLINRKVEVQTVTENAFWM